jgi:hypothetical protein
MNANKKWAFTQCPRSLIEAISLHSLLLNLGFSLKENVFVSISDRDVAVILRAQGKEAPFRVGGGEYDGQTMSRLWKQLIRQWNTGGGLIDADKDEIYWSSKASRLLPVIVAKLLEQGFQIDTEKAQVEHQKLLERN